MVRTYPDSLVVKKGETGPREEANVLIAEDERDQAELYKSYIDHRYNVTTVYNGPEALKIIEEEDFDVILLDRRMPDMSGGEVLERIENDIIRDTRIAMITAVQPDTDLINLPVDDYKVKPIYQDELISLVNTLLLRNEFQILTEQLFALTSKRAALTEANQTQSEQYNELTEEIDKRRERIDEILDTINNNSIFRAFPI